MPSTVSPGQWAILLTSRSLQLPTNISYIASDGSGDYTTIGAWWTARRGSGDTEWAEIVDDGDVLGATVTLAGHQYTGPKTADEFPRIYAADSLVHRGYIPSSLAGFANMTGKLICLVPYMKFGALDGYSGGGWIMRQRGSGQDRRLFEFGSAGSTDAITSNGMIVDGILMDVEDPADLSGMVMQSVHSSTGTNIAIEYFLRNLAVTCRGVMHASAVDNNGIFTHFNTTGGSGGSTIINIDNCHFYDDLTENAGGLICDKCINNNEGSGRTLTTNVRNCTFGGKHINTGAGSSASIKKSGAGTVTVNVTYSAGPDNSLNTIGTSSQTNRVITGGIGNWYRNPIGDFRPVVPSDGTRRVTFDATRRTRSYRDMGPVEYRGPRNSIIPGANR